MKILINQLQKIQNILCSLEIIMNETYNNLSQSQTDLDVLSKLMKKKKCLFKEFSLLSHKRKNHEKILNISPPYKNYTELHVHWAYISKKCFFLRDLNVKNKILINKKFYLNQRFLDLFPSHNKFITYNTKGNLKNLS